MVIDSVLIVAAAGGLGWLGFTAWRGTGRTVDGPDAAEPASPAAQQMATPQRDPQRDFLGSVRAAFMRADADPDPPQIDATAPAASESARAPDPAPDGPEPAELAPADPAQAGPVTSHRHEAAHAARPGPMAIDLEIAPEPDGPTDLKVIELHDPTDVLTLEFAEDPEGHLHLVLGRAEARLEDGHARSAWIDVYLSGADSLDSSDLDESGELPPDLATHVVRIDLGTRHTGEDGIAQGAVNEDPELYFDRDVASEIEFSL